MDNKIITQHKNLHEKTPILEKNQGCQNDERKIYYVKNYDNHSSIFHTPKIPITPNI